MKRSNFLLSITFVLFIGFAFAFVNQSSNKLITPKKNSTMIKPPVFNHKPYEKQWLKVDSLERKGLYASALEVCDKIFKQASAENNPVQVVKAVIFKMKYNSYLKEEEYVVAIAELEKISAEAQSPLKELVHSITADVYNGYYQRNRWTFYNRSTTVEFKNNDISTWDLKTLSEKVIQEFNLSLSNTDLLQKTAIADYQLILNYYSEDSKRLKPTLYDFLAWRAYLFFAGNEFEVTRPAEKFTLNEPAYLGNRKNFLEQKIQSADSLSTKLYATQIIASLIAFHNNDKDPYPLVFCDLERLKFMRGQSALTEKDSLYHQALVNLAKEFEAHEAWTEIQYYIAAYTCEQAARYNPSQGDAHKWEFKKAIEICEKAIQKNPKSYGAGLCKYQISSIKTKSFNLSTVDCSVPNQPSLAAIDYKNVKKLWFRVINVGYDFDQNNDYSNDEKFMKKLISYKPVKTFQLDLQDDGDYQSHAIDFSLPDLPAGAYYILASANPEFTIYKNSIDYQVYDVSNISYIDAKTNNGEDYEFYILSRTSGKPLIGAKATLISNEYDSRSYKYKRVRGKTYTADENGRIVIESTKKDYRYFNLDIVHDKDRYISGRQHYQYRHYPANEYQTINTYFFTDRKIYRPGQTVYFKGIQIRSTNGKNPELVTNNNVHVEFKDVNYQKVAELDLTTNDYGSFSGSFTAPQGVLNGNMQISDGYGSHSFLVEEYKRPKFEVEFKPVDETYRLNDTVTAKGFAKAYSGAMIDGAEVKYRVVRGVSYWRWCWWWGPQPYTPPVEILNGTTKTDEKGEFKIKFNAVPDKATNPKQLPVFNYTVYADITDINGETRTSNQNIGVGYHTMHIEVGIGEELDRNTTDPITLRTTNLNYTKVNAVGKLRILRLINNTGLTVERKVTKGDRHQWSKEEFKKQFPYELYEDENNYEKWQRGRVVYQSDFDTEKSDSLVIPDLKKWEPGIYVLEAATVDKWKQEVKETLYFTVYDETLTALANPKAFSLRNLTPSIEPGQTARILLASAYPDVKALVEWEVNGQTVKKETVNLNNEQKILSIPVEETYRGNMNVSVVFVYNNRFYSQRENITVPFSNKELDVQFETFRNKLYPGQDEEWKIKIKGAKGDKVAAELLLTMYDASLDAFASNAFYLNVFHGIYSNKYWESSDGFSIRNSTKYERDYNTYESYSYRYMYELNWFGYYPSNYYNDYYADDMELREEVSNTGRNKRELRAMAKKSMPSTYVTESSAAEVPPPPPPPPAPGQGDVTTKTVTGSLEQSQNFDGLNEKNLNGDGRTNGLQDVKARTNLGETAFFFPQLETNEAGDVLVKFKMPESLTKWKILGLAHTKDLSTGTLLNELVTQKDLMVVPNMPRFLRESDKITLSTKISNISDKNLSGSAQLLLMDAFTGKPIDHLFELKDAVKSFDVKAKQSSAVEWAIQIPYGVEAVTWRVVAKANNFSDGEESALPILSNRMMVTESMPLHIRKKGSKEFNFTKLINSKSSSTLKNYKLTLEYCSNPAWYGIQSLPYLMEYPYECAEQTFSRFYANSIAYNIANSNPKIKAVFDAWKTTSPETFLSNLEKNQELKAVVLEETPWVLEAKSESERKKRVGLLFDFNKMADELERAIKKLEKMQAPNGGWPWFPGMPESRYITQHIVTGMGHLDKLGVKKIREDEKIWRMVKQAVEYLDHEFARDFRELKRYNKNYLKDQTIGYYQVQYLYARSYFKDLKISGETKEAVDYYIKQEQKYWLSFNLYAEAMMALTLNRYDDKKTTADIVKSLKERSIYSEEMGRYWKEVTVGYYWYEAPIETQAMMIECFDEAANDQEMVEDLKVWLLKNKQTNAWQTTKATTEACYALLLRGSDWLANDEPVEVQMGGKKIDSKEMGVKTEAGTGYYKMNWSGDEIKPEMGKIKLTSTTNSVSWGAIHWQYFEDIDKITSHETPIKLKKELFVVENTPSGPVIKPIGKTKIKIGDKIRVRIELRLDRQMEFVHMKDMRAAGFEPVNVISRYKYQDGLGYYESTRDAATHFFFDNIGKGTYVFEYDLRVAHAGDFSNGMAQIQCMYAPEFNSHSDGVRVSVNTNK